MGFLKTIGGCGLKDLADLRSYFYGHKLHQFDFHSLLHLRYGTPSKRSSLRYIQISSNNYKLKTINIDCKINPSQTQISIMGYYIKGGRFQ